MLEEMENRTVGGCAVTDEARFFYASRVYSYSQWAEI